MCSIINKLTEFENCCMSVNSDLRVNCDPVMLFPQTGLVDRIRTGHSLAEELDLPMSASERWIGFLVWCRCFLSRTKLIFSRSSGDIMPSSICLSIMSSAKGHIYISWGKCVSIFSPWVMTLIPTQLNSTKYNIAEFIMRSTFQKNEGEHMVYANFLNNLLWWYQTTI